LKPFVQDPDFTLYVGDVIEVLSGLPDESVHCCVTSPPYWGLRDYGTEGQIGLEATPELFVAAMVDVFREVRRVLRRDGTCWLNLGDSYNSAASNQRNELIGGWDAGMGRSTTIDKNLKPKDLCGIPWRVAFALQADGWYLRSDIVWSKPNPMPESVTDRPTKAHEYVFLLTKSAKYHFDQEAVREANTSPEQLDHNLRYAKVYDGPSTDPANGQPGNVNNGGIHSRPGTAAGRNIRSVWEIATQPYPQAHFATFPEALPERCIKAGTSERGCCPECGAPWVREVERDAGVAEASERPKRTRGMDSPTSTLSLSGNGSREWEKRGTKVATTGWTPSCDCMFYFNLQDRVTFPPPVPCTVLDPFMGSGTTALVARKLGRRSIGIELNPEYAALAADRLKQLSLFAGDAA
jgi:DNA modification methylase